MVGILFLFVLFQRWFVYSSRRKLLSRLPGSDFPDLDQNKYFAWKTAEMKFYNVFILFMKRFVYLFLLMIVLGIIGRMMQITKPLVWCY